MHSFIPWVHIYQLEKFGYLEALCVGERKPQLCYLSIEYAKFVDMEKMNRLEQFYIWTIYIVTNAFTHRKYFLQYRTFTLFSLPAWCIPQTTNKRPSKVLWNENQSNWKNRTKKRQKLICVRIWDIHKLDFIDSSPHPNHAILNCFQFVCFCGACCLHTELVALKIVCIRTHLFWKLNLNKSRATVQKI